MDLERSEFTVRSLSPLLMHNGAAMLAQRTGMKARSIPSPDDEAKAGAYLLPSGDLFMPCAAFRRALIDASASRKIGKKSAKTVFKAAIFAIEEIALLTDPETHKPLRTYEVDVRRCVLRGTDSVRRARPRIDQWAATFALHFDPEVVADGRSILVDLLNLAGKIIGVGNYRPEKGGHYGRFQVV